MAKEAKARRLINDNLHRPDWRAMGKLQYASNRPSAGAMVAFIVDNGAPVELLQTEAASEDMA